MLKKKIWKHCQMQPWPMFEPAAIHVLAVKNWYWKFIKKPFMANNS